MDTKQDGYWEEKEKKRRIFDILLIPSFAVVFFYVSSRLDLLEKAFTFSRQHEFWELDELITAVMLSVISLSFFSLRRWKEANDGKKRLLSSNKELRKAISEIKRLRGILPICAYCKRIKDDTGYWQQVELYISEHSDADFSHSFCPECMKKLYPEFAEEEQNHKASPV